MMEKLSFFVEEKMAPPFIKFSNLTYVRVIQSAFMLLTPLFIIGSFFILIPSFPIPAWEKWIAPHSGIFWSAVSSLYGLCAIGVVLGVSYFLAQHYHEKGVQLNVLSTTMIALFSFLLLFPVGSDNKIGSFIKVDNLGSTGMFAAIIVGIIAVEIVRFFTKRNITIKMPENVPPNVAAAFTSLIPGAACFIFFWFFAQVLHWDIPSAIMKAFQPLVSAGMSGIAQFVGWMLDRLLWFIGLHGSNIVGAVLGPVWTQSDVANVAAAKLGHKLPYTYTDIWLNCYVRFSVLPTVVLLCISKVKSYRSLGRLALPASIFNIAEPVMFGLPIILNPILFIPWIGCGILFYVLATILTAVGFLPVPYIMVPWTTPAPLMGFFGTGGSWASLIYAIVCMILWGLIWWPFIKVLEKKQLAESPQDSIKK
jgi:PTS system cellobiose-specific IIC component